MGKKQNSTWLTDEVASFLAQCPSREALLEFRPSARALSRFDLLRAKSEKTPGARYGPIIPLD